MKSVEFRFDDCRTIGVEELRRDWNEVLEIRVIDPETKLEKILIIPNIRAGRKDHVG